MRFRENCMENILTIFMFVVLSPLIILMFLAQFIIAIEMKKKQKLSFKEAWKQAGDFFSD